jgi:IMP dehydrogenase
MIEYLTFDDVQILPRCSKIESRSNCSTVSRFTRNHLIENPLIAAPMDTVCGIEMAIKLWSLGSVGILHRFMTIDEQVESVREMKNTIKRWSEAQEELESLEVNDNFANTLRCERPVIACSVGATGDWYDRAIRSIEAGANVVLIDVAHGHHEHVRRAIKKLDIYRDCVGNPQFDIIAGNVATREGAQDLESWGADAIRVGIGGGSACETRIRTGIGVPQLTAIMEAFDVVKEVPIIADGGIRLIGDVAKAICGGADTVMLGSLFAGTDEAPGAIHTDGVWPTPRRMKLFRGSASESQKASNGGSLRHVEGTAKLIPLKGPVHGIVDSVLDGLKSSMSYLGVQDISEMQAASQFIRITAAGMAEARPHILRE